MTDLTKICEYLAVELLGWDEKQKRFERGKYWLDPILTGNGMLEIIEAMRKRGLMTEILTRHNFDGWEAYVGPDREYSKADTLPEAVARAAYDALEG